MVKKDKPQYRICSFWSSNNRPDNVVINIPKDFVLAHKFLDSDLVKITNLPNGVLIQPLREVITDGS